LKPARQVRESANSILCYVKLVETLPFLLLICVSTNHIAYPHLALLTAKVPKLAAENLWHHGNASLCYCQSFSCGLISGCKDRGSSLIPIASVCVFTNQGLGIRKSANPQIGIQTRHHFYEKNYFNSVYGSKALFLG